MLRLTAVASSLNNDFCELSNLGIIFMHSELLAIVSVKSKKLHFFSHVLKPEKEKLCFIIPDKIPLC